MRSDGIAACAGVLLLVVLVACLWAVARLVSRPARPRFGGVGEPGCVLELLLAVTILALGFGSAGAFDVLAMESCC